MVLRRFRKGTLSSGTMARRHPPTHRLNRLIRAVRAHSDVYPRSRRVTSCLLNSVLSFFNFRSLFSISSLISSVDRARFSPFSVAGTVFPDTLPAKERESYGSRTRLWEGVSFTFHNMIDGGVYTGLVRLGFFAFAFLGGVDRFHRGRGALSVKKVCCIF